MHLIILGTNPRIPLEILHQQAAHARKVNAPLSVHPSSRPSPPHEKKKFKERAPRASHPIFPSTSFPESIPPHSHCIGRRVCRSDLYSARKTRRVNKKKITQQQQRRREYNRVGSICGPLSPPWMSTARTYTLCSAKRH